MKRIFLAAMIVVLITIPLVAVAPVSAQSQHKAVILSSLESLFPMGFYGKMISYELAHAGYQVTFLSNTAVTIDFLLTQLNNYDVVIWRTQTYNWKHATYWYVGQKLNSATQGKYGADIAQGWINGNAGIVGVNTDFFSNHFSSGLLSNVKLIILLSSNSFAIAGYFSNAGSRAVVFCNGAISLSFGLIDDLTGMLLANLAAGHTLYDSVYNTLSPFQNTQPRDPLDSTYTPPFWYLGDSTLTLK